MKICIYNVTSCFIPGGIETYCWEMGRALTRRGHDVTLVAGARGTAWHDEVRLLQFPFRVEQDWLHLGTRFRRLMERLSLARHALKPLLAADYDAVVICKPYDFPVLWWAKRRGLRAVTAFHSGGTDFYAGDRWFAGAVDRWVGVSRYTAKQQEARYGRKTAIVHNGVDVERFRPMPRDPLLRAKYGLPEAGRTLISVGRLVGWKGLRMVVGALPALDADVHYLVVGAGADEALLRAQAAALGVTERVHFAGRVEHANLPALLSQADLYVQPSIGEEAFGISVIEAMACALPVVASRNGGLPEVVAEGETGWLVPPGDQPAWSAELASALADKAQLVRFGAQGRMRAEQQFSWAAGASRLEAVLQGADACAGS
jgi:glycosyltransferase involved in cell wall biosynthesis